MSISLGKLISASPAAGNAGIAVTCQRCCSLVMLRERAMLGRQEGRGQT
jgi:hypothetical protein